MNVLLLLERESQAETKFLTYESIYAEKHNFPEHWVRLNPKLQLAAFLEWQVATKVLSVYQARRKFVTQYPESNRAPVPKTIICEDGFHYRDDRYALGSVITLIEGYKDSIRYVEGIEWEAEN